MLSQHLITKPVDALFRGLRLAVRNPVYRGDATGWWTRFAGNDLESETATLQSSTTACGAGPRESSSPEGEQRIIADSADFFTKAFPKPQTNGDGLHPGGDRGLHPRRGRAPPALRGGLTNHVQTCWTRSRWHVHGAADRVGTRSNPRPRAQVRGGAACHEIMLRPMTLRPSTSRPHTTVCRRTIPSRASALGTRSRCPRTGTLLQRGVHGTTPRAEAAGRGYRADRGNRRTRWARPARTTTTRHGHPTLDARIRDTYAASEAQLKNSLYDYTVRPALGLDRIGTGHPGLP
ncbi:hypothetical protein QJS66_10400 [Kocuria rhizophila]|nr:hypothetical protein QJS66_10400 [Kocuria rhizophila]